MHHLNKVTIVIIRYLMLIVCVNSLFFFGVIWTDIHSQEKIYSILRVYRRFAKRRCMNFLYHKLVMLTALCLVGKD